jgi:hypothetical protein
MDNMSAPDMVDVGDHCDGASGNIAKISLAGMATVDYIQLGDSLILGAEVTDGRCQPVVVDLMEGWSSSAPTVFSVSALRPSGQQARGVSHKTGTSNVKVAIGTNLATVQMRVVPRIASVIISPAAATISVGDSVLLAILVTDTAGRAVVDPMPDFNVDRLNYQVFAFRVVGAGKMWIFGRAAGTVILSTNPLFDLIARSTITVAAR